MCEHTQCASRDNVLDSCARLASEEDAQDRTGQEKGRSREGQVKTEERHALRVACQDKKYEAGQDKKMPHSGMSRGAGQEKKMRGARLRQQGIKA
jgi:hypothetical protein